MAAILARLALQDVIVDADELRAFAAPAAAARSHLAQLMVQRGHCASVDEVFQTWLGRDGKAYVPGSAPSAARCLQAIRDAGGVAIEAHPLFQVEHDEHDLDRRYARLAEQGLVGVEVLPPPWPALAPRAHDVERAVLRHGLLPMGGSDFHGEGVTGARLGEPSVGCDLFRRLRALLPLDSLYRAPLERNAWRARHLEPAELEQSFEPTTVCSDGPMRTDLLAVPPPEERPAAYPPARPYVLLGPGALVHEAHIVATLEAAGAGRLHAATGADYPRVAWQVYEMFGGSRPKDARDLLRFELDRHLWGDDAQRCRVLWFDAPPGLDLERLKATLRRGIGPLRFYRVVSGGLRDTTFTSYLHLPDPEDVARECWLLARLGLEDPAAGARD